MRTKKKPSDYPQFNFRVPSEEDKEKINALLKRTQDKMNSHLGSSERKYAKNEVLTNAIFIGLNKLLGK